jgi:intracellular sulfur oxidation DsrE/DsrF family protein
LKPWTIVVARTIKPAAQSWSITKEVIMKIIRFIGLISSLVLLCTLLATGPLMAQEEKPFADQKFVLQISDMDPAKQTLVLNVAGNILKAYGPDQADVEIVAFGPGLRLLFEENSNSGRIDGLVGSGVRFFACSNTITNMSKILGKPVKVNTHATSGKGGIVRIKELTDQGYLLVKP